MFIRGHGAVLTLIVLLSLCSCERTDKDRIVVGFSFATLMEERWSREKDLMVEEADSLSMEAIFQAAGGDETTQHDQIENLITQGVDVLIIIPQNSEAAVISVESAKKEGIPCIAYDRFIPSDALDLYISFDNVKIGEKQAQAIADAVPEGRYLWLGGSPTDDNAHLIRRGHMNVLAPHLESGRIELAAEQWCEGWRPEEALKHAENALTASGNRIDAVLASNDGTAGAAIQALEAQGMAGKVPVSGQDAELAACRRIAAGTQQVTIFKDVRLLVREAFQAARSLARKEKPRNINGRIRGVDAILLDVTAVTQDNLDDVIAGSGFHSSEEIYRFLPPEPKPREE